VPSENRRSYKIYWPLSGAAVTFEGLFSSLLTPLHKLSGRVPFFTIDGDNSSVLGCSCKIILMNSIPSDWQGKWKMVRWSDMTTTIQSIKFTDEQALFRQP
jgi:hypothetical protein